MTSEIAWRRTWKPDLKSYPWQPVLIDAERYLIKFKFTQNSYEILVTDLVNFWYEELEDTALKKRIQKLNPSVEASLTRILDQIQNSLENPGNDCVLTIGFKENKETGEEKMILKINSQLAGMPFVWHFIGETAAKHMASDNLTVPLIAMVGELTRRQKELIKIIQNKDKEIDDYKSQGVKPTRKHFETKEFVETAFENEMLMSKSFTEQVQNLGDSGFTEEGQDLYRQIMTKHAWLNRSPSKKDKEDSLLDDDSLVQGDAKTSGPSWGASRLPPSIEGPKSISPEKMSPKKSPEKSPKSSASSTPQSSPIKDSELLRRQALERRLEMEEMKKQEKTKKKKKIAF